MLNQGLKQKKQVYSTKDWMESHEDVAGGFIRLSTHQIMLSWWARVSGLITPFEFRLFFAAAEIAHRREAAKGKRGFAVPSSFSNVSEWQGLLGAIKRSKIRSGLKKLTKLGLIKFYDGNLSLINSPDEFKGGLTDYHDTYSRLGKAAKRSQPVPAPRRIIRLLAGGVGKGVSATILGVLIRCLYRKKVNGKWESISGGLISAAWIANVFGVGKSTVKHAFSHLEDIGWISRLDTPHWARQAHGARTLINLSWERPVGGNADELTSAPKESQNGPESTPLKPQNGPESTPLKPQNGPESTPPESTIELSTRYKHQDPGESRPVGVLKNREIKKPSMRAISLLDLKDTKRLLELFKDATNRGLIGQSDSEKLLFVAYAERALTKGTINPCGLFVRLLKNKLGHHITIDDEDAARIRLKRFFYKDVKSPASCKKMAKSGHIEAISPDLKLFIVSSRVAKQKGIDPFLILRHGYGWNKERFELVRTEFKNRRESRYTGI